MSSAWLILFVYGLFAVGLWWWVHRQRQAFQLSLSQQLRLEGKEAEAEILGCHQWDIAELMRQLPTGAEEAEVDERRLELTRDGKCYVLEYRLEIPGDREPHHFFRKCQASEWKAARNGQYVPAIYWPENIALHQLQYRGGLSKTAIGLILFWLVVAGLPFL